MNSLTDFAAALLPPEAGGPDPSRVAKATGEWLGRMPPATRAVAMLGFRAIGVAARLRNGTRLAGLDPQRRAAHLAATRRLAPGGIDALKALMLLAWGAESYGEEIAAVANVRPPGRPDPELDLTAADRWPAESRCDVIVVGSGAGGAFAARELARAGLETVIVEEGERWTSERIRAAAPLERFGSLYRDAGTTMAVGVPPVSLPIGRAVGGTTVVNSGTCFVPPPEVRERWYREAGLALTEPEALERRLEEVQAALQVAPAPREVLGRNAELALAGAAVLGWEAEPLRRNAPGCRGSCQCAIGCPNNAKNGVHLNALPDACAAGARIASGLRVERLLIERGRGRGVLARRADGSAVRIHASRVVVAAGATQTPPLLRRSGLGRHPRLGFGLSIHPALGVAGVFEQPVHAWRGVLQSVGVEQLHRRDGVLIEATATPPGMGSMLLPGLGPSLVRRLEETEHTATLGAMIADPPSGRVVGARRSVILYRLTRSSAQRLRLALGAMGRIMLAAGARRVEFGPGRMPVTSEAELDRELAALDVRRLHLAAFHPTGTAAAGSDPRRHPVGPDGRLRGADGVWVADASILPSCPGVNPQLSIMALAAGVGETVARA